MLQCCTAPKTVSKSNNEAGKVVAYLLEAGELSSLWQRLLCHIERLCNARGVLAGVRGTAVCKQDSKSNFEGAWKEVRDLAPHL